MMTTTTLARRFGFSRLSAALLGLTLLVMVSGAPAQETVLNYVKPRVNKNQYAAFCMKLELDREQRGIVNLLFEDYSASITELVKRISKETISMGRLRVEEAFAGRLNMPSRDLRLLRAQVLEVYHQCGPEADALVADLITSIGGVLNDEQKERLPAARRELRREIMLHARQIGRAYFSYAGEGEDVMQLVAEARSDPGSELRDVDEDALERILSD